MNKQCYHITNGDSLTERLEKLVIQGDIITMRECFIDGPRDTSQGFDTFFKEREAFIYSAFGEELSYKAYVVSQFNRMRAIPEDGVIYFWFEDDLFCQANFWFLLYFLKDNKAKKYLVRSGDASPYSFASLSDTELNAAINNKLELDIKELNRLWECYMYQDTTSFSEISKDIDIKYPFIRKAFKAHIDRITSGANLDRPREVVAVLYKEYDNDFGKLFREFSKQLPIYGYGDVQVYNMVKEFKKE